MLRKGFLSMNLSSDKMLNSVLLVTLSFLFFIFFSNNEKNMVRELKTILSSKELVAQVVKSIYHVPDLISFSLNINI